MLRTRQWVVRKYSPARIEQVRKGGKRQILEPTHSQTERAPAAHLTQTSLSIQNLCNRRNLLILVFRRVLAIDFSSGPLQTTLKLCHQLFRTA